MGCAIWGAIFPTLGGLGCMVLHGEVFDDSESVKIGRTEEHNIRITARRKNDVHAFTRGSVDLVLSFT